MFKKLIVTAILSAFLPQTLCPPAQAQAIFMPPPGQMVQLSTPTMAPVLQGITFHPDNPLLFDFILDQGESRFTDQERDQEVLKLVRYFLAGLALEEKDLWVNLSPHEPDRIMNDALASTELGSELLAQDYLLKQISSSLMYPEDEIGKSFWESIYQIAFEKYGTTDIPVDTFNKIWITPDVANVYVNGDTVFIAEARLKVLLERDYVAAQQTNDKRQMTNDHSAKPNGKSTVSGHLSSVTSDDLSSEVIRSQLIPIIEEEVNNGAHFAPVRQIFHSLILAKWFKQSMQESFLGQVYMNEGKIEGIDLAQEGVKADVYQQYLEAYKVGVFDFIKDEVTNDNGQMTNENSMVNGHQSLVNDENDEVVARHYFSGGADYSMLVGEVFNAPWFTQGLSTTHPINLLPSMVEIPAEAAGLVAGVQPILLVIAFLATTRHIGQGGSNDAQDSAMINTKLLQGWIILFAVGVAFNMLIPERSPLNRVVPVTPNSKPTSKVSSSQGEVAGSNVGADAESSEEDGQARTNNKNPVPIESFRRQWNDVIEDAIGEATLNPDSDTVLWVHQLEDDLKAGKPALARMEILLENHPTTDVSRVWRVFVDNNGWLADNDPEFIRKEAALYESIVRGRIERLGDSAKDALDKSPLTIILNEIIEIKDAQPQSPESDGDNDGAMMVHTALGGFALVLIAIAAVYWPFMYFLQYRHEKKVNREKRSHYLNMLKNEIETHNHEAGFLSTKTSNAQEEEKYSVLENENSERKTAGYRERVADIYQYLDRLLATFKYKLPSYIALGAEKAKFDSSEYTDLRQIISFLNDLNTARAQEYLVKLGLRINDGARTNLGMSDEIDTEVKEQKEKIEEDRQTTKDNRRGMMWMWGVILAVFGAIFYFGTENLELRDRISIAPYEFDEKKLAEDVFSEEFYFLNGPRLANSSSLEELEFIINTLVQNPDKRILEGFDIRKNVLTALENILVERIEADREVIGDMVQLRLFYAVVSGELLLSGNEAAVVQNPIMFKKVMAALDAEIDSLNQGSSEFNRNVRYRKELNVAWKQANPDSVQAKEPASSDGAMVSIKEDLAKFTLLIGLFAVLLAWRNVFQQFSNLNNPGEEATYQQGFNTDVVDGSQDTLESNDVQEVINKLKEGRDVETDKIQIAILRASIDELEEIVNQIMSQRRFAFQERLIYSLMVEQRRRITSPSMEDDARMESFKKLLSGPMDSAMISSTPGEGAMFAEQLPNGDVKLTDQGALTVILILIGYLSLGVWGTSTYRATRGLDGQPDPIEQVAEVEAASATPYGGIDLGDTTIRQIGVSSTGAPEFDPVQLQRFQQDLRGLVPVPAAPAIRSNLPLLSGFPQSSDNTPLAERGQIGPVLAKIEEDSA